MTSIVMQKYFISYVAGVYCLLVSLNFWEEKLSTIDFKILICDWFISVCIPYFRVVNVSSALGALNNLSPVLQQKFASPKLTVSDIEELMEKYIRWEYMYVKKSRLYIHINVVQHCCPINFHLFFDSGYKS